MKIYRTKTRWLISHQRHQVVCIEGISGLVKFQSLCLNFNTWILNLHCPHQPSNSCCLLLIWAPPGPVSRVGRKVSVTIEWGIGKKQKPKCSILQAAGDAANKSRVIKKSLRTLCNLVKLNSASIANKLCIEVLFSHVAILFRNTQTHHYQLNIHIKLYICNFYIFIYTIGCIFKISNQPSGNGNEVQVQIFNTHDGHFGRWTSYKIIMPTCTIMYKVSSQTFEL